MCGPLVSVLCVRGQELGDPGPDHPVKYLVKLDGNKNRMTGFPLAKEAFAS